MIKVCHILSGDLWAGAEVMDFNLLKCLKGFNNLEISVILLNEGKLATEIRCLGIHVDVVDETRGSIFEIIRNITKILIRSSPDIIHSHGYKGNILAFLCSKNRNHIRLVSTMHGMPEYSPTYRNRKYQLLQEFNKYLLSKSFSKIVVVSNNMADIFVNKYGISANKIAVIWNGINILEYTPLKKYKKYFIIGSMGRLFQVKDYPLMVEIAREVCRETNKIRFELAGDGPEKEKIMDLIERYKLGEIFSLRGFVENPHDFYQGLDIYLNTSMHEGIPMSVLEAMSYGIPIIAPNVGGLKEMMNDGIEGYLVNGRDPKAFAIRCLHLFKNRSIWTSMATSAKDKVQKEFSIDRMTREYYHLYLDVAQDVNSKQRMPARERTSGH